MTRTGQAAIDYAESRVCSNCMEPGYCLQYTRECFALSAVYASAIDAWNATRYPHAGDRNPPPAVPVWFDTSSIYGHICFHGDNGTIDVVSTYSDDIKTFTSISQVESMFGGPYLGWAEDLNGVRIYSGEDEDMPLNADDKAWITEVVTQIVAPVKARTDKYLEAKVSDVLRNAQNGAWGYVNKELEDSDAYSILRHIRTTCDEILKSEPT